MKLEQFKKVHFIGIGGIGISAIARMLHLEGKRVTGSDRAKSEVTKELEKLNIPVAIPQKAENIPRDADLVIYTVAIPDDNPELVKAKALGIQCLTYPEALGEISKDKYTIAVSGTHGKTTTTAMIAKILMDAGLDPTVIVGSFLKNHDGTRTNFIAGKSRPARLNESSRSGGYLVVEACEYKRSFLNLSPSILVITNIDDDHLDYYKDIDDITSAFNELAEKIPKNGFLVCDLELPHVEDAIKNVTCSVIDYELFGDQNLKLKVPGEHNLANAAAALAVADLLGIKRKSAEKSLEHFAGTWRRFEYKGTTKKGAVVYDDYGHHPTEVKATLRGARELFRNKKIIVVFQPHLYSRTKQHLHEFGKAFVDADVVVVAPIYPAREPFDPTISAGMVKDEIIKNKGNAEAPSSFEEITKYLQKEAGGDDVIIIMGAGDVDTILEKLI